MVIMMDHTEQTVKDIFDLYAVYHPAETHSHRRNPPEDPTTGYIPSLLSNLSPPHFLPVSHRQIHKVRGGLAGR